MLFLEYQPVRERMLINAQAVLGSGSTQRSAPNDSGCRSAEIITSVPFAQRSHPKFAAAKIAHDTHRLRESVQYGQKGWFFFFFFLNQLRSVLFLNFLRCYNLHKQIICIFVLFLCLSVLFPAALWAIAPKCHSDVNLNGKQSRSLFIYLSCACAGVFIVCSKPVSVFRRLGNQLL